MNPYAQPGGAPVPKKEDRRWTPEEDAIIRLYWGQGKSPWGISRMLVARTRAAVIGRAYRLGLPKQEVRRKKMETSRVHNLRIEAAVGNLRRNGWIVHLCNERGAYDPKGKLWRVGNLVLTEDQLIERAAKYERLVA